MLNDMHVRVIKISDWEGALESIITSTYQEEAETFFQPREFTNTPPYH